ncbi:TPA: hypothetical protein MBF24_005174 [Klebsiella pneumoniae]|nr:hypothetical protein [Klebsiella pneumoniae]
MSEPMVIRFQEMAMNSETPIASLLRMAKAIAVKLDLKDVDEWMTHELNGYPRDASIPEYRIIRCELKAIHPHHGLVQAPVPNWQQEQKLTTVFVREAAGALEAGAADKATLSFRLPTEYAHRLQSNQPEFLRFDLVRIAGYHTMLNIVDQVRNRLHEWSLELEQQGILGEHLQFSQREKERAPMTTNNFNFNGNVSNAGVIGADNHAFTQQNTLHITAGDFDALKARLELLGFAPQDVQELKMVLDSEPAPKDSGRVLPKVYAWIGKAGERVLDAGLDKAAPLAIEAITKYLGA